MSLSATAGLDGWPPPVRVHSHRDRTRLTGRLVRCLYPGVAWRAPSGVRSERAIACAGWSPRFVRDGVEGFLVHSDIEMAEVTAGLVTSSRIRFMQEHNRTTRPALDWPETVERSIELYHRAAELVGTVTDDLVAAR